MPGIGNFVDVGGIIHVGRGGEGKRWEMVEDVTAGEALG